jgi:hypothetical protein
VDGPKHVATFSRSPIRPTPRSRALVCYTSFHPCRHPRQLWKSNCRPDRLCQCRQGNSAAQVVSQRVCSGRLGQSDRRRATSAVWSTTCWLMPGVEPLMAKYDRYTSCPITTEKNRLLLAEFKYRGNWPRPFRTFKKFSSSRIHALSLGLL